MSWKRILGNECAYHFREIRSRRVGHVSLKTLFISFSFAYKNIRTYALSKAKTFLDTKETIPHSFQKNVANYMIKDKRPHIIILELELENLCIPNPYKNHVYNKFILVDT